MEVTPTLGDPVDSVVTMLVREAARRALAEVGIESRPGGDSWQVGPPRRPGCGSGWTNSTIRTPGATRPTGW